MEQGWQENIPLLFRSFSKRQQLVTKFSNELLRVNKSFFANTAMECILGKRTLSVSVEAAEDQRI